MQQEGNLLQVHAVKESNAGMPISLITQQGEEEAICNPLNKFWKMHDQYNLQYLIPFNMKPSQGEKTSKTTF